MEMKIDKLRKAGNRGRFYPFGCAETRKTIELFEKKLGGQVEKNNRSLKPRVIVSPHAGYVYSGFTACSVHRLLRNTAPDTVLVVGPSHHVYFEGISAAFTRFYETPCRTLETDLPLLETLHSEFDFSYEQEAHFKEHSTETQMPLLAHYHGDVKVVELVYGRCSPQEVASVIDKVLDMENTAVVISSDLSHFHTLEKARRLDKICLDAMETLDNELIDRGCEACGITGIKAMIEVARQRSMSSKIIDYRTSAEAFGDSASVVGYGAAVFW